MPRIGPRIVNTGRSRPDKQAPRQVSPQNSHFLQRGGRRHFFRGGIPYGFGHCPVDEAASLAHQLRLIAVDTPFPGDRLPLPFQPKHCQGQVKYLAEKEQDQYGWKEGLHFGAKICWL